MGKDRRAELWFAYLSAKKAQADAEAMGSIVSARVHDTYLIEKELISIEEEKWEDARRKIWLNLLPTQHKAFHSITTALNSIFKAKDQMTKLRIKAMTAEVIYQGFDGMTGEQILDKKMRKDDARRETARELLVAKSKRNAAI